MKIDNLEKRTKDLVKQLNEPGEKDIAEIKEKLQAIDAEWKEAAVREPDGSIAPGQAKFSELLHEAHQLVSNLM
jgi:hypothetical protein